MEYFSRDHDEPLREIEKETLYSGKAIGDLTRLIELLQLNSRPRRHIRNTIAAAIITMSRINKGLGSNYFSVPSLDIAKNYPNLLIKQMIKVI
jgi:hypothetical protein